MTAEQSLLAHFRLSHAVGAFLGFGWGGLRMTGGRQRAVVTEAGLDQ